LANATEKNELEVLLREGVESARNREHTTFDDLVHAAGGRIVLFGAGYTGRTALRNLRAASIEPVAFADNNERLWGTRVDSLPILSPAQAAQQFGRDALFVVTIWSANHIFRDTRNRLEQLGVRRIISASPLRWRYPEGLLPYFCQDFPHKVYAAAEKVRAAAELWTDDFSHREYLNQVKYRAFGDFSALSYPVDEESYFPSSLFQLLPNETFVDCGAYVGDTARRLLELTQDSFSRLFEIEPDPANYCALQSWASGLPAALSAKTGLFPIALGSSRGQVSFDPNGTEIAAVSSSGSLLVECHRLDDLLDGICPTYIKMDIEGSELDALEGAGATLARCSPVLAICLYHRQSHLWEIPLKVASFQSGYRFYLRPHDVDGWQTVMYAVPPDRAIAT
jgi:FkbM family methyltransferase